MFFGCFVVCSGNVAVENFLGIVVGVLGVLIFCVIVGLLVLVMALDDGDAVRSLQCILVRFLEEPLLLGVTVSLAGLVMQCGRTICNLRIALSLNFFLQENRGRQS